MTKTKTAKKANHANPIEEAEAVIADLEAKRSALISARAEGDRQMASVSYRAHAHGDPDANDQLDEYVESALRHEQQIKSIDAAIVTAKAKLDEAKQAEAQTQGRKTARELLRRADAIVEHARALDEANRIRVERSRDIAEELMQMRSLAYGAGMSVGVPSHEQFLSLGSRADQTAHQQTPFAREYGDHLAPHERRTHSSYAQSWHAAISKAVAALAGEDHKHKEGGEKAA